jgi:lipoate-protein ligase B
LRTYGVEGSLTDDPGVWVTDRNGKEEEEREGGGMAKKIAAVGVHLRRNISSYGVGFNVTEEPMGFFRLIVPCGLAGKEATSLEGLGVGGVRVEEVAGRFVSAFVERLRDGKVGEVVEGVDRIREEDVLGEGAVD